MKFFNHFPLLPQLQNEYDILTLHLQLNKFCLLTKQLYIINEYN